jgi:hypothetical protein
MSARAYTAHLPRGGDPVATLLVDDRWRWGAFLFPLLWALFNRHWLAAVWLLPIAAATAALAAIGEGGVAGAIDLGLRVAVGFEGAALIRLDRRLRGWRTLGAVSARDDEEAERLWFTRLAAPGARDAAARTPERTVPRAGGGKRPRLEPGLGDPADPAVAPPRRPDPPFGGGGGAQATGDEPSFWSAPSIAAEDRAADAGAAPPPLIADRRERPA